MTTPALFTVDDALNQLGITEEPSPTVIGLLTNYTAGIVGALEKYLREVVVRRSVTDRLRISSMNGPLRLRSAPVIELTSVVSRDGDTTWDVANMDVTPGGLIYIEAPPRPWGTVDFTYDAGYDPIPANYVQGGLVILQHVWETQRGVGEMDSGVIGPEEMHQRIAAMSPLPRKALEWLGSPRPVVF